MATLQDKLNREGFAEHALNQLEQCKHHLINSKPYSNNLRNDGTGLGLTTDEKTVFAALENLATSIEGINFRAIPITFDTIEAEISAFETALRKVNLNALQNKLQNRVPALTALNDAYKAIQAIPGYIKLHTDAPQLEQRRLFRAAAKLPLETYYNSNDTLITTYETTPPDDSLKKAASEHPEDIAAALINGKRAELIKIRQEILVKLPGTNITALDQLIGSLKPGSVEWPANLNKNLVAVKQGFNLQEVDEIEFLIKENNKLKYLAFLSKLTGGNNQNLFKNDGKLDNAALDGTLTNKVSALNEQYRQGIINAEQITLTYIINFATVLQQSIANLDLTIHNEKILRDGYSNGEKGPLTELTELLLSNPTELGHKFEVALDSTQKIVNRLDESKPNTKILLGQLQQLRQAYKIYQQAPDFDNTNLAAALAGQTKETNILNSEAKLNANLRKPASFIGKINNRLQNGELKPNEAARLIARHQQSAIKLALSELRPLLAREIPIGQNILKYLENLLKISQTGDAGLANPDTWKAWHENLKNGSQRINEEINKLKQYNSAVAQEVEATFKYLTGEVLPKITLAAQLAGETTEFEHIFAIQAATETTLKSPLIDNQFHFHSPTEQELAEYCKEANAALLSGKTSIEKFATKFLARTGITLEGYTTNTAIVAQPQALEALTNLITALKQSPIIAEEIKNLVTVLETKLKTTNLKIDHPIYSSLNSIKQANTLLGNQSAYQNQIDSLRLQGKSCELIQEDGKLDIAKIEPVSLETALKNESQAVAEGSITLRDYYRGRFKNSYKELLRLIKESFPDDSAAKKSLIAELKEFQTAILQNNFSATATRFESLRAHAASIAASTPEPITILQQTAINKFYLELANYEQAIKNYKNHRQLNQNNLLKTFVDSKSFDQGFESRYFDNKSGELSETIPIDPLTGKEKAREEYSELTIPKPINLNADINQVNEKLNASPESMVHFGENLIRSQSDEIDDILGDIKRDYQKPTDEIKELTAALTKLHQGLKNKDSDKLSRLIDSVKQKAKDAELKKEIQVKLDYCLSQLNTGIKLTGQAEIYQYAQRLREASTKLTTESPNVIKLSANGEIELEVDTRKELIKTVEVVNNEINSDITSTLEFAERSLQYQAKELTQFIAGIKTTDPASEEIVKKFKTAIEEFIENNIETKPDAKKYKENYDALIKQANELAKNDKVEFDKKEFGRQMGFIQNMMALYNDHLQIQASLTFFERSGKEIKFIDENTGKIHSRFSNPQQLQAEIGAIIDVYGTRFKVAKVDAKGKEGVYYQVFNRSAESAATLIDMLAKDKDLEDTNDFLITSGLFSDSQCLAAAQEALRVRHTLDRTIHLTFKRSALFKVSALQKDLNEIFQVRKEFMQTDAYQDAVKQSTVYIEIFKKLGENGRRKESQATFLKLLSVNELKVIFNALDKNSKEFRGFVDALPDRKLATLLRKSANAGDALLKMNNALKPNRYAGIIRHLARDKNTIEKQMGNVLYCGSSDEHVDTFLTVSNKKIGIFKARENLAAKCLFPQEVSSDYQVWLNKISPESQSKLLADKRFSYAAKRSLYWAAEASLATKKKILASLSPEEQAKIIRLSVEETVLKKDIEILAKLNKDEQFYILKKLSQDDLLKILQTQITLDNSTAYSALINRVIKQLAVAIMQKNELAPGALNAILAENKLSTYLNSLITGITPEQRAALNIDNFRAELPNLEPQALATLFSAQPIKIAALHFVNHLGTNDAGKQKRLAVFTRLSPNKQLELIKQLLANNKIEPAVQALADFADAKPEDAKDLFKQLDAKQQGQIIASSYTSKASFSQAMVQALDYQAASNLIALETNKPAINNYIILNLKDDVLTNALNRQKGEVLVNNVVSLIQAKPANLNKIINGLNSPTISQLIPKLVSHEKHDELCLVLANAFVGNGNNNARPGWISSSITEDNAAENKQGWMQAPRPQPGLSKNLKQLIDELISQYGAEKGVKKARELVQKIDFGSVDAEIKLQQAIDYIEAKVPSPSQEQNQPYIPENN